eukprot:RCo010998
MKDIQKLLQLRHIHVVSLLECSATGDLRVTLTWERLPAEVGLLAVVQQHHPLSFNLIRGVAFCLLEALDVLHREGLFHGCLSAENVVLSADLRVAKLRHAYVGELQGSEDPTLTRPWVYWRPPEALHTPAASSKSGGAASGGDGATFSA